MRDALNASGRAIFFSNEYPAAHENYPPYGEKGQYNFTWMVQNHGKDMGMHANMWRISQDIGASCECLPAVCAVPALHCLATIEVTAVYRALDSEQHRLRHDVGRVRCARLNQ